MVITAKMHVNPFNVDSEGEITHKILTVYALAFWLDRKKGRTPNDTTEYDFSGNLW